MTSSRTSSRLPQLLGATLAGVGVAHFVVPAAFVEITRVPHPVDTETWVQRDGMIETGIGLALIGPRTRRLGYLALVGYGAHLAYSAAQHR